MNITCPQCGFSRELAPDRIPDRPVVATCPKCACRFRFSAEAGVTEGLTSASPAPAGDDPLPPGAIIPGATSPDAESADDLRQTARQAYAREARRMEDTAQEQSAEADRPVRAPRNDTAARAKPAMGENAEEAAGQTAEHDAPAHDEASALPPWQTAPGRDGWLVCFYQTVLLVLFAAQRFFAGLDPRAPQMRALSFFLIVCVIQITAEYFWLGQLVDFLQAEAADPELQGLASLFSEREGLPLAVLFQTGVQVVKLYAFSALLYLAYRFIAPDRTSFPLVFQIMAYSTAPALLSVIPALGSVAGLFWSLACLLVGCRTAMGLSWQQTLVGVLPLCLVVTSMILQTLGGFGA